VPIQSAVAEQQYPSGAFLRALPKYPFLHVLPITVAVGRVPVLDLVTLTDIPVDDVDILVSVADVLDEMLVTDVLYEMLVTDVLDEMLVRVLVTDILDILDGMLTLDMLVGTIIGLLVMILSVADMLMALTDMLMIDALATPDVVLPRTGGMVIFVILEVALDVNVFVLVLDVLVLLCVVVVVVLSSSTIPPIKPTRPPPMLIIQLPIAIGTRAPGPHPTVHTPTTISLMSMFLESGFPV